MADHSPEPWSWASRMDRMREFCLSRGLNPPNEGQTGIELYMTMAELAVEITEALTKIEQAEKVNG